MTNRQKALEALERVKTIQYQSQWVDDIATIRAALEAKGAPGEAVATLREAFNVMAKRRANELFTGLINSYTSDFYFAIFSEGFYAGQRAAAPSPTGGEGER